MTFENKYMNLRVVYRQEHKELYSLKKRLVILSHKYVLTETGLYITLNELEDSTRIDSLQGLERELKEIETFKSEYNL